MIRSDRPCLKRLRREFPGVKSMLYRQDTRDLTVFLRCRELDLINLAHRLWCLLAGTAAQDAEKVIIWCWLRNQASGRSKPISTGPFPESLFVSVFASIF